MSGMAFTKREDRLRFSCIILFAVSFFGVVGIMWIEGGILRCVLSLIPIVCQIAVALLALKLAKLQRLRESEEDRRSKDLEAEIERLSITNIRLSNENSDLRSKVEYMKAEVSKTPDRFLDDLFINPQAKSRKDEIIEMLLIVEREDRDMINGYALRLALYFEALVRLNYINDSITVFARYFAPHSGRDEDTYVRTFNNMRRHIRAGKYEDEVEAYMTELSALLN